MRDIVRDPVGVEIVIRMHLHAVVGHVFVQRPVVVSSDQDGVRLGLDQGPHLLTVLVCHAIAQRVPAALKDVAAEQRVIGLFGRLLEEGPDDVHGDIR